MHLQGDMYRVLPGMLRVWSGFPLACPFRVVPPAASRGHEWHMNGQLLGHRYLMQSFASCFRCTSIHHQVQTIWSREAVLSRHTSTALSMAAAFASASAPGIFPSESEGGRHFHWVKKERKENGVTGYSPRNSIFSYFFGFLRPTFNLKAQILLLQLL